MFYWFFEKCRSAKSTDGSIPLILWLTGGPGCSSSLALLTKNGPCPVNNNRETTSANPYSWTEVVHALWFDQPAGVRYSFGAMNDSDKDM